jgi:hypothetical protein
MALGCRQARRVHAADDYQPDAVAQALFIVAQVPLPFHPRPVRWQHDTVLDLNVSELDWLK